MSVGVVPEPGSGAPMAAGSGRGGADIPASPAVARNAQCPCGSGLRFKECCGKMVLPALQASQPQAVDRMQRALALQNEGQLTEAKVLYLEVLDLEPDVADAIHMLGVIHLQTGNYAEALRQLRRAADLFGWRLPAVRHNLGLAIVALLARRNYAETWRLWGDYDRRRDSLRQAARDVSPRVSVVIPSYNHADYIDAAIESVFRQTYASVELIVIDDGSTDDSVERIRTLLRRSPFPHRFHARENRGAAITLNEAVALSTGDFVNVLNSDDRFAPSRLTTMVDAVAGVGALWGFSRVALIDGGGSTLAPESSPRTAELSYLTDDVGARDTVGVSFLSGNPAISSGSLFFARPLFDRLGGFSDFRYNHDWDFCLRASLVAEPVFVPSAQYEYRIHEANTILESAIAAKHEADIMLNRFYGEALRMRSAENPFAPIPAVWGTRFFAQAFGRGHASIMPVDVLRDLAGRAAAIDEGRPK
jgi:glycosyltransferase involved in cell wall biosynthesis